MNAAIIVSNCSQVGNEKAKYGTVVIKNIIKVKWIPEFLPSKLIICIPMNNSLLKAWFTVVIIHSELAHGSCLFIFVAKSRNYGGNITHIMDNIGFRSQMFHGLIVLFLFSVELTFKLEFLSWEWRYGNFGYRNS